MPMVRFTFDPNNPPEVTAAELARLDAMSDAEITVAAESDPDNPPLTDHELARIRTLRLERDVRARTGLGD
jgi:putative transcriptional regulator